MKVYEHCDTIDLVDTLQTKINIILYKKFKTSYITIDHSHKARNKKHEASVRVQLPKVMVEVTGTDFRLRNYDPKITDAFLRKIAIDLIEYLKASKTKKEWLWIADFDRTGD